MRRKFIFFKIFDHNEHPDAVEKLSAREIEHLVGPVTAIDNIFQLSQQPEVKRIVEKDLPLQQALTDSLPRRGRHGYLWVGTDLPDVIRAVSRLAYIKEFFIFQQLLDPEPPFLNNELRNCPLQEFNIYLWRVYRFWSYAYFLDRAFYIGSTTQLEAEVEQDLRILKDELSHKPDKPFTKDPSEMIAYSGEGNYYTLQLDRRYAVHDFSDKRWLRALINSLAADENAAVLNPFCGEGMILVEAMLAGQNMIGLDINPIQQALAAANAVQGHVDFQEFNRLIGEMQGKIKMLMNASAATQVDLFLYSAEGQFLSFWAEERKRLKTLGHATPDEMTLKFVAATRFLIEMSAVTRNEAVNRLFFAALVNTLALALRKKEPIRFMEVYKKNLLDICFNIFLLHKGRSFVRKTTGEATVSCSDVMSESEGNYPAIISVLPSWPLRGVFEKDRRLIAILNSKGAYKSAEEANIIGSRPMSEEEKEQLESELGLKRGLFAKIPRHVQDAINRLELMGKKDDIIRLFYLWKNHAEILAHLAAQCEKGGKVALLVENPEIKLEHETVILPGDDVMVHLAENDKSLKLKLLEHLSKSVYMQRKRPRIFKILLFKKT